MKKEIIIDNTLWEQKVFQNNIISYENKSYEKIIIKNKQEILLENSACKYLRVSIHGNCTNAGGFININGAFGVPIGGESIIPVNNPSIIKIEIIISAESSIEIKKIDLELLETKDLASEAIEENSSVLIVVPNYPSYINLYYCAFAHSRNIEYLKSGLRIQVAAISNNNWYQTKYQIDDVPVFQGNYEDLREILNNHKYDVVITHFVDENLFSIYDEYIFDDTQMIFICHGPETVYRYLTNVTRPYFTKEIPKNLPNEIYDIKDKYIKKYSQKDNAEWCFVSDWLKDFSEQEQNLKFKHSRVINNIINEDLFPYHEKKTSDRTKILIIRKFDNIIQHSIDQSVMAIEELSKKDYFNELEFNIYGDGNYFDTLLSPLLRYKNVHIHRTFIPNKEIHKIHAQNGILMLPSRHDAHAVAMGEGAASGLVVIGSNVTSNGFFMNNKENHTMTDPEDPIALANVIDRLYNNPEEFLEISKRLSQTTKNNYCKRNTVAKEIKLINEKLKIIDSNPIKIKNSNKILSLIIRYNNKDDAILKCLKSIVYQYNINQTDLIIVSKKDNLNELKTKLKNFNCSYTIISKAKEKNKTILQTAIEEAKGKYFKIVNSNDWLDSENLSLLIEKLKNETANLVITKVSVENKNEPLLKIINNYYMLKENQLYDFDNLIYDGYGFKNNKLELLNCTFETTLKENLKLNLLSDYYLEEIDFMTQALCFVNQTVFYNIDLYRLFTDDERNENIKETKYQKEYEKLLIKLTKFVDQNKKVSNEKANFIKSSIILKDIDLLIKSSNKLKAKILKQYLKNIN